MSRSIKRATLLATAFLLLPLPAGASGSPYTCDGKPVGASCSVSQCAGDTPFYPPPMYGQCQGEYGCTPGADAGGSSCKLACANTKVDPAQQAAYEAQVAAWRAEKADATPEITGTGANGGADADASAAADGSGEISAQPANTATAPASGCQAGRGSGGGAAWTVVALALTVLCLMGRAARRHRLNRQESH